MLANLTEDIPDFGDTALDEYFLPITPYHGETNSHNFIETTLSCTHSRYPSAATRLLPHSHSVGS